MRTHDAGSLGARSHSPLIDKNITRIVGCVCGWRTPPGASDSDDEFTVHHAIATTANRTVDREGQMEKKSHESAFNGVKVFAATMMEPRQMLGEKVTQWIEEARRTKPGFELVDIVVSQSSDEAFHCISMVLFFQEDVRTAPRRKVP